jgi:FlaA1/EpsC-like NDP-sugar epimerase
MGEQVRILELAELMIRRAGYEPGRDIAIRFTGVRPGEKLEEELAGRGDRTRATRFEKIRIWELPAESAGDVSARVDMLSQVVDADGDRVRGALRDAIPEFDKPAVAEAVPMRLAA